MAELEAERQRLLELQREKEEEQSKKLMDMISKCIKSTMKEAVRREVKKVIKLQTAIKTKTAPWMDKVRKKVIKERRPAALKSSSSPPLADTVSIEPKCSDESIAKRV